MGLRGELILRICLMLVIILTAVANGAASDNVVALFGILSAKGDISSGGHGKCK